MFKNFGIQEIMHTRNHTTQITANDLVHQTYIVSILVIE